MGVTLVLIEIIAALLAVALVLLLGLYKHNLSYWRRKKVLYVPNPQIPLGNITNLVKQKETLPELTKNTYNFIKSNNAKHGGLYFFGKPVWMPVDIDLLNNVLIKDFSHFVNHGFYVNGEDDPLSAHLFSLEDDNWRRMRAALSHTFTTGKIKMMFPLVIENARHLEKIIEEAEAAKQAIDIKDYISRFSNDVICSTAFGLEVNSIQNPNSDLRKVGTRFFDDTGYEALRNLISFIIPRRLLLKMRFKLIKPDITEYFMNLVKNTIDYREKNNIQRKDFIQLLIQLKNTGKVMDTGEGVRAETSAEKRMDMHLTVEEMAAQIFVFYLAGFETSSTTSTFALLELALHQDVQDKAREEVRRVLKKHNGEMTYEACMEMNYLNQVIKETLRKYPPLAMVTRLCTKDYEVPGSEVVIEKDTLVMIPIVGVQNDPDIYPDPEKFDPDRFSDGNTIPNIAFLSFGEGPRICIGKRFGMIQTKVALATVIKNHRVTVNTQKTEIPIKYAPKALITTAKDGVWLNMTKIHLLRRCEAMNPETSMEKTFNTIIQVSFYLILLSITSIIILYKWSFRYWRRRGIPSVPEPVIPFGNILTVVTQKETLFEMTKRIYLESRKMKLKHCGMYLFGKPVWIPIDLELIRNILIRDSSQFMNHGLYVNERDDPLTANIFLIEDEKWRLTRAAITQLFSPVKLKTMFGLMLKSLKEIGQILSDTIEQNKSIDMKDYSQRFFMNVIASYTLGLEINTFKNPDCEFRRYGKQAVELAPLASIKFLLSMIIRRKWLEAIRYKLNQKDIEKFFLQQISRAVDYRLNHGIKSNDFLQFFMEMQTAGVQSESEGGMIQFTMSLNEVAGNVFTFFVAGFESSSSTTTYALLELSLNQDIQDKVRKEVIGVLAEHKGELTYAAVAEMEYLEQVVKETLRKYPPGATLPRICTKDYKTPDSDQIIEKDTLVFIPVLGIHHDPDLYPDPEVFNPDRFSPRNKQFLPNNLFLPFGEGPRMCIGMRLGVTQVKTILSTIIKDFKITLDREKTSYPPQYSTKSMMATPTEGVWFHVSRV
ncbi:uncharacterized protein LOC123318402 [Coccinella septempunctata]|uniref:uncharacterized protein LOC123318402 n=1 Tax=Coccinella septempunctata TaxID=41139 RepID=UPI001D08311F|nr:uncharacterized protein LOC123318402 [Coccinella septempunctata]